MTDRDPIDYLLSAMEQAGQHVHPAKHGYGAKRRAVLDAIKELRAALAARDEQIANLTSDRDAARAECERLRAAAMRVELLESALRHIGDFAHARSTGPTVPDALWAVWGMAYAELP